MGAIIVKYPEDPTGINPNNLVINEPHDLGSGRNRAFVPNYGAYFTESMIVKEVATGRVLTKGTHYIAAQLQQEATLAMDKEICAVVVITDPTVQDQLLFTYQVVGGVFSTSVSALQKMIEDLDLDERAVEWGAIIGKPTAFPPAPHLHDIGDLYGFEYLVEALDALRNAILIGDEAAHDELRQYIQYEDGLLRASIAELKGQFDAHAQDFNNPHKTTKAQVGLGNVDNYGTATTAEAQAGTSNAKFMTPLRTAEAITQQALIPLNAHIADKNNPHNVTKAQVGLGNVENYAIATTVEAQAGTSDVKYMTPLKTKDAIAQQALIPLNAHIADKNNPHQTTKAQVGLGSVENFALATTGEAQAGTSNLKYMTPLLTAQAIAQQALIPLNAHINNTSNPHQTTKAQVGLSDVDNFATATTAEATAGVLNTKFMTPLRTKEAITAQAGAMLQAHLNDLNNPHQTTKAQVGLSLIPNSITRSRVTNSDGSLLTAGGMYDHVNSTDHDGRYAPKNAPGFDCSVHWNGAGVYVWGGGAWRQVWPAQWAA
ncbi:hypothetical protein D3C81_144660 [compost metagenome]|jgi:hypothetical protein